MTIRSIVRRALLPAATLAVALAAQSASADVYITEFMYRGLGDAPHEFIEFTNLGASAVDFSGWSFDDDSRQPGVFDLSSFGLVGSGESVIITEMSADAFRDAWGLSADVKVLGGYTNNLGRADEINLFNGSQLVDRLNYGDQIFPGSPRTDARSASAADFFALGANDINSWQLASNGDSHGSYTSLLGEVGNPGSTPFAPVPLPAAAWLLLSGLGGLAGVSRVKRSRA
ncbi:MAG TPA: lamin tail domain-containing protein [Steroidobacteraceae bacterium]|nr:lamin tail domain-containing protein [Steroidobacteraceae bacterium]